MGDEQLAYWIPRFFVEVHMKKRKKGVSPKKYPPKTVYALVYTKTVWMSSRLRSTLVTKVLVELGATRGQLQDNEKCQIWCWTVLQRNHSEATMRRRIGTQMITLWYLLWEKRMWVWIPSASCPFLSQLVFHHCRRVFAVHVTTTSVAEMWTLHYLQGLSVELKWNIDSNFILPCMAIYITEWYWFWSA